MAEIRTDGAPTCVVPAGRVMVAATPLGKLAAMLKCAALP